MNSTQSLDVECGRSTISCNFSRTDCFGASYRARYQANNRPIRGGIQPSIAGLPINGCLSKRVVNIMTRLFELVGLKCIVYTARNDHQMPAPLGMFAGSVRHRKAAFHTQTFSKSHAPGKNMSIIYQMKIGIASYERQNPQQWSPLHVGGCGPGIRGWRLLTWH